jgi:hypothetical protein
MLRGSLKIDADKLPGDEIIVPLHVSGKVEGNTN